MEEKIYNVLLEILSELQILNKVKKRKEKYLTDEDCIELFVDFILNHPYNEISKSDLRAAKIVSAARFKSFWDKNLWTITHRMKDEHNIFLSRAEKGCFLYKKTYKRQ